MTGPRYYNYHVQMLKSGARGMLKLLRNHRQSQRPNGKKWRIVGGRCWEKNSLSWPSNRLQLCLYQQAGGTRSKYNHWRRTVYPKKYAHGFVVLCFNVVMQSFIMNSHEVFIHIHQGCFAGTGAIVRLPQCQWSKPDRYGKISQCITTTKHSKAKTVCIFLGIYCKGLT